MCSRPPDDDLERLALSAFEEFDDISDYIWKSPRFINSETKIEIEKLDAYFPFRGDPEQDEAANRLRKMRWRDEGRKLLRVFPYVMANGNLFTSISVFETYCLLLCKSIEKKTQISLSNYSGSGILRCFNYFAHVPIDLDRVAYRKQVSVAIRIRNCLFHANGLLTWSKDEKELRRLVAAREFLPKNLRTKKVGKFPGEVMIVSSRLGDRIQISNEYSHDVAYYLKCQFVDLCKHVQIIFDGQSTINLPITSALD